MNRKTTENRSSAVAYNVAIEGKTEVAVNTRITMQFLKFKKLAVAASLGLVAGFATHAASLP